MLFYFEQEHFTGEHVFCSILTQILYRKCFSNVIFHTGAKRTQGAPNNSNVRKPFLDARPQTNECI